MILTGTDLQRGIRGPKLKGAPNLLSDANDIFSFETNFKNKFYLRFILLSSVSYETASII